MNRFLKVLTLLVVSLFVLVSGVDAALDHMSRSEGLSAVTVYNQQGRVVLAYSGDLNGYKACLKPGILVAPLFHRT